MNKAILHKAVDLLSRREHSVKELKHKLVLKAFLTEEIDEVLSNLVEKNYLSDERFAETVVRQRVSKGYGWRFIENELKQKGVGSATISQVKAECLTDWFALAQQTYRKRYSANPISDHKDKAKRMRYLQQRGFSTDEIFHAVNDQLSTDLD